MIVDFQADFDHARCYDIIDTATGRSMADQPIFYADDETGVYRVWLTDADGRYYADDSYNLDEKTWEERRGNFRLVLKASEAAHSTESAREGSARGC